MMFSRSRPRDAELAAESVGEHVDVVGVSGGVAVARTQRRGGELGRGAPRRLGSDLVEIRCGVAVAVASAYRCRSRCRSR